MSAEFLTRMMARHQVAVLYLRHADEPEADEFFRERCELIEEVVKPTDKNSLLRRSLRYLQAIVSLLRFCPLWVTDWSSREFAVKTALIVQKFQPDIIQADYHVMGQYLHLCANRAPRILIQHEPGVRAAPYVQTLPSMLSHIIHRIERLSWRRYEARLYRRVEAIVVFTEADRSVVQKMAGQTPIHMIPPGTAISERPLNPFGSPSPTLLFVGNFFHPPNVDAARRLIHSIFPAVQRCIPGVKLFIVGDQPPAEIQKMSTENIVITGRVPDVTPYLDQAALFVAPLHLGGGLRIKILEALAAGKAVVTTPLAAEGLNLTDGEYFSLAEDDREFAERITHLLIHPEERASLARRARSWACANLGWDQTIESHEALWQTLLSGG